MLKDTGSTDGLRFTGLQGVQSTKDTGSTMAIEV